LSRDEELKARWARYAAISATLRAEGGPRLNTNLASRVSAAILAEPPQSANHADSVGVAQSMAGTARSRVRAPASGSPWWAAVGGVAVAASVAAAAILWVRFQSPGQDIRSVASNVAPTPSGSSVGRTADNIAVADHYVVPKTNPRRSIVPSTQLANYVVA